MPGSVVRVPGSVGCWAGVTTGCWLCELLLQQGPEFALHTRKASPHALRRMTAHTMPKPLWRPEVAGSLDVML